MAIPKPRIKQKAKVESDKSNSETDEDSNYPLKYCQKNQSTLKSKKHEETESDYLSIKDRVSLLYNLY